MADDGDSWRPTNLNEGVDRKVAYADYRVRNAGIAGAIWGFFLVLNGVYQYLGGMGVGPIEWNFGAGIVAMLLAMGAASRSLLTTALLALVCVGEFPAVVLTLGELFAQGNPIDQMIAAVRIASMPYVLYTGIQGYAGCYEYKKLRRPYADRSWRAINPAMLTGTIVSAFGCLVIGFMVTWSGSVMEGFQSPGSAVLNKDGTVDMSSRLSLHLRDEADKIKPFRREEGKPMGEEGDDEEGQGEGENGEAGGPGQEEQWKVQEPANRYDKDDVDGPEPRSPPGSPRRSIGTSGPAYDTAKEAIQFAAASDKVGCLTESLRRHDACKDEDCRHLAGVFVTACLPQSKPTAGFCTGVPSVRSVVETAAWRTRLCDPARAGEQACHVFYANLQTFCHPEDVPKVGG